MGDSLSKQILSRCRCQKTSGMWTFSIIGHYHLQWKTSQVARKSWFIHFPRLLLVGWIYFHLNGAFMSHRPKGNTRGHKFCSQQYHCCAKVLWDAQWYHTIINFHLAHSSKTFRSARDKPDPSDRKVNAMWIKRNTFPIIAPWPRSFIRFDKKPKTRQPSHLENRESINQSDHELRGRIRGRRVFVGASEFWHNTVAWRLEGRWCSPPPYWSHAVLLMTAFDELLFLVHLLARFRV